MVRTQALGGSGWGALGAARRLMGLELNEGGSGMGWRQKDTGWGSNSSGPHRPWPEFELL